MREIEKTYFIKRRKLVKTTTFAVTLLVAVTLIFSSAITAVPSNSTKMNEIETEIEEIHSTGLPPRGEVTPSMPSDAKSNILVPAPIGQDGYLMYMEHVIGGGGAEHFSIDTEDPANIYEDLGDSIAGDFLTGGTYGCDFIWYGVEYAAGILWGMDLEGDMWSIGGGGTNLNGLAFDPLNNRMYGVGSVGLDDTMYEINPDTGEQTELFDLDYSGGLMIGMAFDAEGVLYGWELVQDKLWIIDIDEESLEEVGPLGIDINFAQDGDFHRESDRLFLNAYTLTPQYGAFLYEVNKETGEAFEQIGPLPNGWECAAACFENGCIPPDHDVGVKKILKPEASGYAVPSMEMELLVKNYGINPETFDAQMEIIKCESSGEYLLEEHFDGDTFPPEGWETDYWKKGYGNFASGEAPEAMVYKYDYGGQTYDNYIQTKPFDATGWEKILVNFRFAADLANPQYCSFFVKYRKNETSNWKDVTPWDNPLNEQKEGDLYEIGCYGFGEELGENFSIRFSYQGYYSYFNNFYLDDVTVEGCAGCAEYAEIVEDLSLDPGEEMTVVFPGWEPSEWHNESYEDTWEAYPVHAFTIMDGDQQPRNDNKWMLLDLYYPWLYDIEITEIGSPQESRSMPARTFDVEATIKNVGQYPLCCIPIDITIGAPVVLDTLFTEYDWPYGSPPYYYIYYPGYGSGWTDEHKQFAYYYGWQYYNNNMAGGDAPEAYLPYYYCYADNVFYSAAFDTSEYASLQLSFLMYVNHYSGQGLYTIEAGYSHDGENWYAAWSEAPGSTGGYEVSVPIEGGSETTYVGFWVKGNPFYFNYLYLDNVEVAAVGLIEEYTDEACQGDDLEPGQSRVFNFDDWTPDFLAEETTASEVPYKAQAVIEVEGDKDPGNDIAVNDFELDYWHDPALEEEVTSPSDGRGGRDILWENGEPDGLNGLAGSFYYGYSNIIIDDFTLDADSTATGGDFSFVWNSAAGTGNMDEVKVFFFQETGDCDPSMDEYAELVVDSFEEELTGDYYFGRPEIVVTVEFAEVELAQGNWWVGFQPNSVGEDLGYMLTAENKGCEIMIDLPYFGYPRWTPGSSPWSLEYDLAWALYGYSSGPPGIDAYIQPGTESIDAVAINYGTFNALDLTCYAEIWEFITDPDNGTLQYEDNVTNIDLDEPLGGTVDLPFDDFTFAYEGRYGLYLEMPATPDDDDKNNNVRWGVGVDDTKPDSWHAVDPPDPTGLNGWYVSDVEVTLEALDPVVMDVDSKVKEIKYKVGTGGWQTITGDTGTFVVHDDGDDIPIEYYAIDNVGNEESPHNTFTIDMDQTPPDIGMMYEFTGDPIQGWEFNMTATATDDMSGMVYVEFRLNEVLQTTVYGPGPTYRWSFWYKPPLKVIVRATAFDEAGLFASFEQEPVNNNNQNQQSQSSSPHVMRMRTLPLQR